MPNSCGARRREALNGAVSSGLPPIFGSVRYELVRSSGECLEAFDCPDAAVEVLISRIFDDPTLAEEIAILEFDDGLGQAISYIEVDPELLTPA